MLNQAFEILGIAPTEDGRVIRSAFLRLARIYHPDRFVDMPEDVRREAERRMKEATTAYESLRAVKPEERAPQLNIDDDEIQKRAQKYRVEIEKKRVREESDRARWRRWEAAEEVARERQRREADIASRLAYEMNGYRVPHDKPPTYSAEPDAIEPSPKPNGNGSLLNERLNAAKRGEKDPLVPRSS